MPHPQERPRIGFIGLGIMGTPMAGHLAAAGYPCSASSTSDPSAVEASRHPPRIAVATGAARWVPPPTWCSPCFPTASSVQQVALGPAGSSRRWRRFAASRCLLGTAVAHPGNGSGSGGTWHRHDRRPGQRCAMGRRTGQSRVHGRRAARRRRAGPPDPRSARAGRVPPVAARLGHVMKCINNTITAMTLAGHGRRPGARREALDSILQR